MLRSSVFFLLFCLPLRAQYTITTFAGGGTPNNLPATSVGIGGVTSVAADLFGNVYVLSTSQNRVFRIDSAGVLTVAAGNGGVGYSGDGGPAVSATLAFPQNVAVDNAGNLFIADTGNCTIRKVAFGLITTVVGSGPVRGPCSSSGDGGPVLSAALAPFAVAVDQNGVLYIADGSTRIRKVANGVITLFAGNGNFGDSGDGGPAVAASIDAQRLTVDRNNGSVYITETYHHRVRVVANGIISTFAGNGTNGGPTDGAQATATSLGTVGDVAVDSAGNVYICGSGFIYVVTNGVIHRVAPGALGFSGSGIAVDSAGSLYLADYYNRRVQQVAGGTVQTFAGNGSGSYLREGLPATEDTLATPGAVAVDSKGSVYFADSGNGRVRRITNGAISTVATYEPTTSRFGGEIALDAADRLYLVDGARVRMLANGSITTVAGNGIYGYSEDGGPATNARIFPLAIAVSLNGDLYIVDGLMPRIRKVSQGVITTVAGNGSSASPGSGDGGPATEASFFQPIGIALDDRANLYIQDVPSEVRKVSNGIITHAASSCCVLGDRAGDIYLANSAIQLLNGPLIAGSELYGFSGDGGPALSASLINVKGLAVDASGKIYVADSQNNRIRVLTPTPAAFPFGSFDTPTDHAAGVAGAMAVTGWALDQIGVNKVEIWREPVSGEIPAPNGMVFVGNATFVAGARPDVQTAYPGFPANNRAGWGYQLLTNGLPSGNGTFKLHAIARNATGLTKELGVKTITVDNAHASKPFGTIDTPDQGGTASGSQFVNFAWALTPQPQCIPLDGSTITVTVDGVALGHPVYNQRRSDIVAAFPGYCNTNGAVGYYFLDTTKLTNGVHTIGWLVYDNAGHGEGIGSRFFTVTNGTSNSPESLKTVTWSQDVTLRRGFDTKAITESPATDQDGTYSVTLEELDRIELRIGATEGYALVGGARERLPAGSTLQDGVFYWQLGPGFLREHSLLFVRPDATTVRVRVNIQPKQFKANQ